MGGAVSAGEDNEELVDNLVEAEYIRTRAVEACSRLVDRGNYYLPNARRQAYRDTAWRHEKLHISAPCIYAEVLEALNLQPGMSFLNLGSGTGYLSTLAGLLLGSNGVNHGVELHSEVVEYATQKLKAFLLSCNESVAIDYSDFCEPKFVVGNCLLLDLGTVEPYDRVYCGAGVPAETEVYIRNFVKVGGVVVMPCGEQLQRSVRTSLTGWESSNILPVSFASLIMATNDELHSGHGIQLPERAPCSLQNLCRAAVRHFVRITLQERYPQYRLHSTLKQRQDESQSRAEEGEGNGATSEATSSVAQQQRIARRRRIDRRINIIPVFPNREEEEEEERGGGRRRIRRRIIAIGNVDVTRNNDMEDFDASQIRWRQIILGGREEMTEPQREEREEPRRPSTTPPAHQEEEQTHESLEATAPTLQINAEESHVEVFPTVSEASPTGKDMNDETNSWCQCEQMDGMSAEDVVRSLDLLNVNAATVGAETARFWPDLETAEEGDAEHTPAELTYEQLEELMPSRRELETSPALEWSTRSSSSDTEVMSLNHKRSVSDVEGSGDEHVDEERMKQSARRQEARDKRQAFSALLKASIGELPLPDTLKNFLNYYRV